MEKANEWSQQQYIHNAENVCQGKDSLSVQTNKKPRKIANQKL